MEKPIYPSKYMRITQGYQEGTHSSSYAIDDAGSDTGIDNIIAPFTGIIKKIYTSDANEVWLESASKVEYPDGTIDYMTILFAHDNDVSNLYVGQKINRGEIFYQEGIKGNASGNHCHIECARGKFLDTGWYKNASGYWSIDNGKKPEECLWIDDSIIILNNHDYSFKKIPNTVVEPSIPIEVPKEDIIEDKSEEINDGKETIPIQKENYQLIFTCTKDDMYAIELKEGEKLYIRMEEK